MKISGIPIFSAEAGLPGSWGLRSAKIHGCSWRLGGWSGVGLWRGWGMRGGDGCFALGGVAGDFGGGGGVGGWRTIMSQNACAYLESLSGG